MGLLISGDVGVLIFCLKPALPCPNLGLIGGNSLKDPMGFNTCFCANMFGSKSLSKLCTSGKHMPLDLACDLVCIKYFPTFSLSIL